MSFPRRPPVAAARNTAPAEAAAPAAAPALPATAAGAGDAPARRPARGPQTGGAGSGGRNVIDPAIRQGCAGKRHRARAQAQACGCDAGAGGDHRSGRPQACRMADPAQRRQWRVGRALSRFPFGKSELAVADLPAPAHRGRPLGRPSRRRYRLVVVRKRIADLGQGQVRAGEGDDLAAATAPMPSAWSAMPGAATACRKRPRPSRSICSARC